MKRPRRREVLIGSGAMLAASSAVALTRLAAASGNGRLREMRADGAMLRANQQPLALARGGHATPAWIYGGEPFPVLRAARGQMLTATLANTLKQHSSIHWHGIRLPNAMDGVPYLTQKPVLPGEQFRYSFAPPDAGTYFFHPHCNTSEQLGRGLAGVLVVEGDETEVFDDDVVCLLKDWRVAPDGAFLPFVTLKGASRTGTFGTLRTMNGLASPKIDVPAGANIRLRLVNADSTRIAEIGLQGARATVIAIDGHPIAPFALETWRLGPAMRLDIALRTPAAGKTLRLVDYFSPQPVTLAAFASHGEPRRKGSFRASPLKAVALPDPDLAHAEIHTLSLGTMAAASDYPNPPDVVLPDGTRIALADSLCLAQRTLWAIDGKAWPERSHEHLPPPLMQFKRRQTVVVEFHNTTPHAHPMHLHGHAFKVLAADKYRRPVHWADTVLVIPDERVRVAFVADNPGNWMIHCHIIEHQDTGMMAWFRVA